MGRLSRFTTEFERRSDEEIYSDHRTKLYKELRKITGAEVESRPDVEIEPNRLRRLRAACHPEEIAGSR